MLIGDCGRAGAGVGKGGLQAPQACSVSIAGLDNLKVVL